MPHYLLIKDKLKGFRNTRQKTVRNNISLLFDNDNDKLIIDDIQKKIQ